MLVNQLSLSEIKELYGTRHIGRDQARQLVGLMDVFCFSEACLLADIVQHFIDAKLEFDASYVYEDVNQSIQHVHRSGLIHRQILSEPQKFLIKKSQVFRFLKMLREKGKKLFLLTNSPFHFVDGGMRYLLEVLAKFKSALMFCPCCLAFKSKILRQNRFLSDR